MSTPSLRHITRLVILCLLPVLATSQLTIPRRTLGYVYRRSLANRSNVVTLTAYLDLTCSDSQQAFPTLIEVADHLSRTNFEFVVQSFSLPYHRNSHTITEAVHIIDRYTEGEGVFPFIAGVYKNLDSLTTNATMEKTDYEVLDILTPIVTEASGISAIEFKKLIAESIYDSAARLDFKYGCTRGVYGTPTFMINDVVVPGQPSWTVDQWMAVITPVLRAWNPQGNTNTNNRRREHSRGEQEHSRGEQKHPRGEQEHPRTGNSKSSWKRHPTMQRRKDSPVSIPME